MATKVGFYRTARPLLSLDRQHRQQTGNRKTLIYRRFWTCC
nr:MAG TPA: hypothetical protein [Caudoviricetes sp.]